ncbi:MAG: type VI secretion system baseplate subunit TssK, partial [Candidatus Kapabacteria bacterium]|nr:type VI secretion system baseplate subunit TssK [Candidatus Kapabacteria bacterium]
GEMSSHVAQRMREKAQFLVSKINNPQQGMSELVIDEFKFFVSCLTESLPLLEGIVATNTSHPYWMYTTLLAIAGRLSSLGSDRIPPQFKAYNHNDLFSSFDQLRKYILRMIAEGVIETFIRIPMRYEAGMYKVELKHQWRDSDVVIAAHPKIGVSSSDLNSWMQSAVIGTEGIHPSLKTRRILGVQRTEIERLPDVLVSKGTLLYAATLDEESVIYGEDLCVENTLKDHADHLPAEMSLYVKVKT